VPKFAANVTAPMIDASSHPSYFRNVSIQVPLPPRRPPSIHPSLPALPSSLPSSSPPACVIPLVS